MANPESFKPLTISANELPALTAQIEERSSYAAQRARLLLGCYRKGDASDPETYVAAIAATLASYPDDVITEVTHPVKGLPSRLSWLPTVSEVHMACEDAMEPRVRQQQRERRLARQMADRAVFEAEQARQRPTLDELKSKYGDQWGIAEQVAKRKTAEPAPNVDQ